MKAQRIIKLLNGHIYDLHDISAPEIVLLHTHFNLRVVLREDADQAASTSITNELPAIIGDYSTSRYAVVIELQKRAYIHFMSEDEYWRIRDFSLWASEITGWRFVSAAHWHRLLKTCVEKNGIVNINNLVGNRLAIHERKILCLRDLLRQHNHLSRIITCEICGRTVKRRKVVVHDRTPGAWIIGCPRCKCDTQTPIKIDQLRNAHIARMQRERILREELRDERRGWREAANALKDVRRALQHSPKGDDGHVES